MESGQINEQSQQYTKVNCGQLRSADIGRKARLSGWVHRRRDQGALIFIDLRDRDGLTQIVFNRESNPEAHKVAEEARSEYVLQVEGTVEGRGTDRVNPNLDTGEIEVAADSVKILNRAKPMPFEIAGNTEADEMLRLKYRYLDLRRAKMQRNLTLRHRVIKFIRDYLDERNFLEIETPILMKSTPKGRATTWSPAGCMQGSFMRSRNLRSS